MAFKLKLEEIVGDFGSTLTGKHKHLVPAYGHGEVATRRRNLATLGNLMNTRTKSIKVSTVSALLVCSLIFQFLWLIFILASSQHACSRSCRLIVHMSFSLQEQEEIGQFGKKTSKMKSRKW